MSVAAPTVLVVGAGLAGLTAAAQLTAAGHRPIVIDKGRSVGGRLATRRLGRATLDHGAQFFTVRAEAFAAEVARSVAAGVTFEWCRGFGAEPDGFPRHACHGGMNALAKWLAADLIDVRVDTRVTALGVDGGRWTAQLDDATTVAADAVVATAPVPQTLALLDAGGVALPTEVADRLRSVRYFATLAVLAVLDGAPPVPEPGGRQLDDGPFSFVADNHRKGISAVPALTLHANHELSARRYDDDDQAVLADLLAEAAGWVGRATVVEAQLKKWRYAGPVEPLPDATLLAEVDGAVIAFAGDAFGGPKVEGAWRSGRAAGGAIAERIAA